MYVLRSSSKKPIYCSSRDGGVFFLFITRLEGEETVTDDTDENNEAENSVGVEMTIRHDDSQENL